MAWPMALVYMRRLRREKEGKGLPGEKKFTGVGPRTSIDVE